MSDDSDNKSSLIWGAILIGMGALFLLDNLRILDFGEVVSNLWPVILIAIGLKIVWSARNESEKSKEKASAPAPQDSKAKEEEA